jgi:hypothetical protein
MDLTGNPTENSWTCVSPVDLQCLCQVWVKRERNAHEDVVVENAECCRNPEGNTSVQDFHFDSDAINSECFCITLICVGCSWCDSGDSSCEP